MSSESEGEIEVALPAGEEGGQFPMKDHFWILWIPLPRLNILKFRGGEEGLDWEYEELPEGAGGDN